MNDIVVFTNLEFMVIVFLMIMLGLAAIISSYGWFCECNRKEKRRQMIRENFALDYHIATFGGIENYNNYIKEIEKSIEKRGR